MTYVVALLAAVIGAVVGWAAAAMIGIGIAGAVGMSNFEGAAGMFAVFGVGAMGGALGLTLGIYLALRSRGYETFGAIATRGLVVLITIGGLVAGGVQVARLIDDTLGRNGPVAVVEFEIRGPQGFEFAGNGIGVELHADKNRVPALLRADGSGAGAGRPILAGSADLHVRATKRILVLSLPEQPKRLFHLELAASPRPAEQFGPWRHVDFLDDMKPDRPPRPAPDSDGFEIRVRVPDRTAAIP